MVCAKFGNDVKFIDEACVVHVILAHSHKEEHKTIGIEIDRCVLKDQLLLFHQRHHCVCVVLRSVKLHMLN